MAAPRKSPSYVLLSVYDKSGIVDFGKTLSNLGYKLISTGGTAKILNEAGLDVIPIQQITGNPESFDGRMKTISFQVESGILFDRKNQSHVKQAKQLKIKSIDIVVCNLYPFEQTIQKPKVTFEEAIENIDVGGPTMVRSAAKNHKNVLVVIDPKDYGKVSQALKEDSITSDLRQDLAAKAFGHLSFYDSQIAEFLDREKFPEELTLPGRLAFKLRYGENPHQEGAVYIQPTTNSPLGKLKKITGRELSMVNVTDIAAGLESVRVFKEPAAVVIKHNSPCGIALGKTIGEALKRAVEADPESAFGGVVVLNLPIDLKTAKAFGSFKEENRVQMDIIAAPSLTKEAIKFISKIRKSTGIYTFGKIPIKRSATKQARFFDGGFILQDWDDYPERGFNKWKKVTKAKPSARELRQMEFGWKVSGRVRSNTILVIDKNLPMTRGIGSGQTSRIRSAKIALEQAGKHAKDGILVSDSFFPFDDSVKLAAKAGITTIVQQGGSINDQASIDAADKAGIAMVFTGRRAFWH